MARQIKRGDSMIKKFKFNDLLALCILVVIIPGIWITLGCGLLTLPGEIVGATIVGWSLVLQYYFRRKPPKEEDGK